MGTVPASISLRMRRCPPSLAVSACRLRVGVCLREHIKRRHINIALYIKQEMAVVSRGDTGKALRKSAQMWQFTIMRPITRSCERLRAPIIRCDMARVSGFVHAFCILKLFGGCSARACDAGKEAKTCAGCANPTQVGHLCATIPPIFRAALCFALPSPSTHQPVLTSIDRYERCRPRAFFARRRYHRLSQADSHSGVVFVARPLPAGGIHLLCAALAPASMR